MAIGSSTLSSEDAGVEQGVTAFLILLIAIHFAYTAPRFLVTLCRSLRRKRLKALCQTVTMAWTWRLKRACSCLRVGSPSQKDPTDVYVSDQMGALRLSSLKAFVYYGQWIVGTLALYMLYIILYGQNPRTNSMLHDVIAIASYALMMLLSHRPSLMTVGSTDMWYSVLMLLVALFIASAREEHIHVHVITCMTLQLSVSFRYLNFKMYAFWNAAVCVTFMIWIAGNALTSSNQNMLVSLILYSVFLVVALRSMELHMEQQLRHRLNVIVALNEHSAARAVLNCVCDVVVELDEHLQLVEHSPRLASMLFLSQSRNLQGAQLQEFMPQKHDQDVFTSNMKRKSLDDVGGMAATFHSHMQDSDCNMIPMELFSVYFEGIDRQPRFMVGIREWTDFSPVAALPDSALRFETQPCFNAQRDFSNSVMRIAGASPMVYGDTDFSITDCSDCSSQSSEGLASAGGIRPLYRGHKLTTEKAKEHVLLSAISGWNVLTPRSDKQCCIYHILVHEALQTLTSIFEASCNQRLPSNSGTQCPTCGIIGMFDRQTSTCSLCEDMKQEGWPYNAKASDGDVTRYDQFVFPQAKDNYSVARQSL